MKQGTFLFAATALTAALLIGTASPDAHAQRRGRGGNRGGFNGANGQPGAANGQGFGPGQGGGFGRGMRNNQTPDPTRSALMTLLSRDDVKSEIMLSQRQGEEMTAEATKDQEEMQKAMQAARPDRNALQGLSQDERRAKQQEARQKQQEIRQAAQATMNDELDKKAQEVLRPEQLKRLKELDLQWRGPLALADPKVADKFGLTADQKAKVTAIVADYRKTQQDTMRAAFAGFGGNGRNAGGRRNRNGQGAPGATPADPNNPQATPVPQAAPATPQTPPDPAEIQKKMDEARAAVDKARTESGTKVLALLTEEQKAAWNAAQGRKFTFRKNLTPTP